MVVERGWLIPKVGGSGFKNAVFCSSRVNTSFLHSPPPAGPDIESYEMQV